MSLAVFDIIFEGARRCGSTSDNTPIAKAIIGIDQLLTAATKVLYGHLIEPQIDVRREDQAGLFQVDLGFRVDVGMARRAALCAQDRYCNPTPELVVQALGWRFHDLADPLPADQPEGTIDGLFSVLIALAGRTIRRVYLLDTAVDLEVGNDTYHISYDTYYLLRDTRVRQAIEVVASSLGSADIKALIVTNRATGDLLCEIRPRDMASLTAPAPTSVVLVDEVRTLALALSGPVYRTDSGWIFSDGLQTLRATVSDNAFLGRIDNGVFHLSPGEILIVKMHIRTIQTAEGLVSQYDVIRVIDQRKPGKNLPMPGI